MIYHNISSSFSDPPQPRLPLKGAVRSAAGSQAAGFNYFAQLLTPQQILCRFRDYANEALSLFRDVTGTIGYMISEVISDADAWYTPKTKLITQSDYNHLVDSVNQLRSDLEGEENFSLTGAGVTVGVVCGPVSSTQDATFYTTTNGVRNTEPFLTLYKNRVIEWKPDGFKYPFSDNVVDVDTCQNIFDDLSSNARIMSLIDTACDVGQSSSASVSAFAEKVKSMYRGFSGDALTVYQQLVDCFSKFSATGLVSTIKQIFTDLKDVQSTTTGAIGYTDNAQYQIRSLLSGIILGTLSAITSIVGSVVLAVSRVLGAIVMGVGAIFSWIGQNLSGPLPGTVAKVNVDSDDRLCPFAFYQGYGARSANQSMWCSSNPICDAYTWQNGENSESELFLKLLANPGDEVFNFWFHNAIIWDNQNAGTMHFSENWNDELFAQSLSKIAENSSDPVYTYQTLSSEALDIDVHKRVITAAALLLMHSLIPGHLNQQTGEFEYYQYTDQDWAWLVIRSWVNQATGREALESWKDTLISFDKITQGASVLFNPDKHITKSMWESAQRHWFAMGTSSDTSLQYVPTGVDLTSTTEVVSKTSTFLTLPTLDRSEIILALILSITVTVVTVSVAALLAAKTQKWLRGKNSQYTAMAEAAWSNYTKHPTAANLKAYRSAVFKNNLVAKLCGGTVLDKNNYWGGGGDTEGESGSPDFAKFDQASYTRLKYITENIASVDPGSDFEK